MGWVNEDVNMVIDGANRIGTLSHIPVENSDLLNFKGAWFVKTKQFPVGGSYRLVDNQVTLGLTPLVGEQVPWVRYWVSGLELSDAPIATDAVVIFLHRLRLTQNDRPTVSENITVRIFQVLTKAVEDSPTVTESIGLSVGTPIGALTLQYNEAPTAIENITVFATLTVSAVMRFETPTATESATVRMSMRIDLSDSPVAEDLQSDVAMPITVTDSVTVVRV